MALPAAFCAGDETERRLCKALWLRYAVAKELFHTRRAVATTALDGTPTRSLPTIDHPLAAPR